ncbi:hypothetical protein QCA50_004893 [Cerrena zonata]|uniref:Sucrase n=1 Tax=Cerrena zonata TaxID=2478898 RepID=A0AAW0GPI3_9APHY
MKTKVSLRQFLRPFSTTVSPKSEALSGTVPYHEAAVFLHTRFSPLTYPKKVPSKLQRTLQLYATQWSGVVYQSWSPEQRVHDQFVNSEKAEWDDERGEVYAATAFSRFRGKLEVPEISLQNLDEVNELLKSHASPLNSHDSSINGPVHLYVCTHAERDCRCGQTGTQVFEALRDEVKKRDLAQKVKIAGTGHVGGHKYAANVLVYPEGEWLGYVRPENAPEVLDAVLARHASTTHLNVPLCPGLWRGRMGLDKEEQLALIDSFNPLHTQ